MNISAAMTRDVIVVSVSVHLDAAVRIMEKNHVRHLPVVRDGLLVGILSDRDLLPRKGRDLEITCADAMTEAVVTCSPSATVGRVAEMMLVNRVDSIPVVDERQHLVGLVTSTDLIGLLVAQAQPQALPFHYRLRVDQGDADLDAIA